MVYYSSASIEIDLFRTVFVYSISEAESGMDVNI